MSPPHETLIPLLVRKGSPRARQLFAAASPRAPALHLFDTEEGAHALLPDGSRIFGVEGEALAALQGALASEEPGAVDAALDRLGLASTGAPYVDDTPVDAPPVRALSLAVAQKCNLGCTYCYAQEGTFGAAPASMSLDVALASVDLLFSEVAPGERVNLAFLGGEPLASRDVVHAATARAASIAAARGARVTFSITTNGTLLTEADGELFERHGFAVTISLDGIGEVHDRLRPFKGGKGSYAKILAAAAPLLAAQRRMQISVRVTVTPQNLLLRDALDELVALGFHSVGFSPMLSSPTARGEMGGPDLEVMLEQMVACGEAFERHVVEGRRYPFANMTNAMRELHRGTHRPYPCGAGAGYLGVSAEGALSACHRFVGDEPGAMGDVTTGVDRDLQRRWLADRHVHRQEPCKRCWARYLCGGGCHHEVIHRGRPACDYIRGWLHYSLGAYVRLSARRPEYFGAPGREGGSGPQTPGA